MLPEPEDLDLAELARAADVTPRTVRYYVQQGLLPSPGTRGPGTKYDRGMLDRLQLIKLLQREHWPLSKIREHLESLDEDGVQRELRHLPVPATSASALKYVRGLLGRDPRATGKSARHRAHDLFSEQTHAELREPSAKPAPRAPVGKWQMTKSTWERIRLSHDVELSVRRPLTREQNKRVDRLLEAARQIFAEED